MSRTHYSDDYGEDFPNQLWLYRANVDRSMASKTGRKMLREILAALDAMPTRELWPDVFIETRDEEARDRFHANETPAPKGAMCALGAWAATALGPEAAAGLFREAEPDSLTMAHRLKALGWPPLVVHEIVFENDSEDHRWRTDYVLGPLTEADHRARYPYERSRFVRYRVEETPAERWQRVRDWIAERLATFEAQDRDRAAWRAAHPYTTPSAGGVGLL